ncbi:uncharacterized protein LOC128958573 [Oppia nitens]|uniref:uncharacterized protein LOC128958573 n=1 Tax=Oppia nitens TaxID=1686743 RepID=UPI0023DBCC2B|nr:uncharacterized protein LOC128958573 [Oppia nitens]
MNNYLILTVFLCTVCLGHTLGLFGINDQQLTGKRGNSADECKKLITNDVANCINAKVDKETIDKHKDENKFMCCFIGIRLDCSTAVAKDKCQTKDYEILKTLNDQTRDDLNLNGCEQYHIITGRTHCLT